MIKRLKSGLWSVFCLTGPGRSPNKSVFSLFFTKCGSVFGLILDIFSPDF